MYGSESNSNFRFECWAGAASGWSILKALTEEERYRFYCTIQRGEA